MTARELELIATAFGPATPGEPIDMRDLLTGSGVGAGLAELIEDDAVIAFETPEGGLLGDMAGPWRGYEGLVSGWREWLEPWEKFTFSPVEWIDAGPAGVLLLGDSFGRLAGSGMEVESQAAALYVFEDERVVRIDHFLDHDQARRAAGLG